MAYTVLCSLIMEKVTLVMPEAITTIERAMKILSKLPTYLSSKGISAMKRANISPTLNKEILPHLVINPNAPILQEVELRSTNTHRDEIVTFGGCSTMRGCEQSLE